MLPTIFSERRLARLAQRVEVVEGKVEQLRAESIHPNLLFPTRRELQQLESLVKELENGP